MAQHVCPLWVGYLLANPLRKIITNPNTILTPYVKKGMKVLDVGCAMGFFSLALARLVGSSGKVLCVDLQQKMLDRLEKRAQKASLSDRIETRLCQSNSLCLEDGYGSIDFALAFAVVHEVPSPETFFSEINKVMDKQGKLFVAEPKGHVGKGAFGNTIAIAERSGFKIICRPKIAWNWAVLLGMR